MKAVVWLCSILNFGGSVDSVRRTTAPRQTIPEASEVGSLVTQGRHFLKQHKQQTRSGLDQYAAPYQMFNSDVNAPSYQTRTHDVAGRQ